MGFYCIIILKTCTVASYCVAMLKYYIFPQMNNISQDLDPQISVSWILSCVILWFLQDPVVVNDHCALETLLLLKLLYLKLSWKSWKSRFKHL